MNDLAQGGGAGFRRHRPLRSGRRAPFRTGLVERMFGWQAAEHDQQNRAVLPPVSAIIGTPPPGKPSTRAPCTSTRCGCTASPRTNPFRGAGSPVRTLRRDVGVGRDIRRTTGSTEAKRPGSSTSTSRTRARRRSHWPAAFSPVLCPSGTTSVSPRRSGERRSQGLGRRADGWSGTGPMPLLWPSAWPCSPRSRHRTTSPGSRPSSCCPTVSALSRCGLSTVCRAESTR